MEVIEDLAMVAVVANTGTPLDPIETVVVVVVDLNGFVIYICVYNEFMCCVCVSNNAIYINLIFMCV